MKARTLIITAAATAALAAPVAQATGRNGLECSGPAGTTSTRPDTSFYNQRALLSASSCTSSQSAAKRASSSSSSVVGLAGARLGTDAAQAAARQAHGTVVGLAGTRLGTDAAQAAARQAHRTSAFAAGLAVTVLGTDAKQSLKVVHRTRVGTATQDRPGVVRGRVLP
jgi:hypothetical protein